MIARVWIQVDDAYRISFHFFDRGYIGFRLSTSTIVATCDIDIINVNFVVITRGIASESNPGIGTKWTLT